MDRRNFLGVATVGALASTGLAHAADHNDPPPINATPAGKGIGPMDVGPHIPMNAERASAILEEYGVDALIALQPYNVYYLTNTVPVVVAFNTDIPAFGVFGREAGRSIYVGSTGSLWDLARDKREVPEAIAWSSPKNAADYINASPDQMRIEPQANTGGYGVAPTGPYSDYEQFWKHAQDTLNTTSAASREWALVRAIKELGLEKRRIAVDDMRVAYLLQRIGYDNVTLVPGENIFRHIRLIKSPYEIEMLRKAQTSTQAAVMAATKQLQRGMTYDDFRLAFNIEAARQGCTAAFLLFGVAQGNLPEETVREGRSYMIDSSVKYRQYMGDFARTVCIGELPRVDMIRHKAQQLARAEAFEKIKPGVPFSVIEQHARSTMIKAGMPEHAIASCYLHSVGLQHDDQPSRADVPFPMRRGLICEAGMALTLDLPYLEVGGGAGHNEDMIHVTPTGYELMNDPSHPLIIV